MKDRPLLAVAMLLLLGAVVIGPPAVAQTVDTLAEVDIGSGGIEVDDDGNVYSSDFGAILGDPSTAGTRVIKIAPSGSSSTFAEGFEGASGNAIDSKGNFYQSNIRGSYITRITPDGKQSKLTSEGIQSPVGIAVDEQDTLYVANCGSASIQKVTSDGTSTRLLQSPLLKCPNGITRDPEGNLYVANFYSGEVVKITPNAEASVLATLPGNNNGHLVWTDGVLYVVARSAHQVYRVELDGEFELVAGSGEKGGADGPAKQASFCYPNDIDVSADGKVLYVNDVADHSSEGRKLGPTRIRRIFLEK